MSFFDLNCSQSAPYQFVNAINGLLAMNLFRNNVQIAGGFFWWDRGSVELLEMV